MAGLTVKSANGKAESDVLATEKDFKKALPVTGQPMGSNRRALDTLAVGVYQVAINQAVESGSDDNLVKITGHAAKEGDVFRLQSSANNIKEFEVHIDEIVDANHFRLSCILSANLTAGDLFTILRPVSQRFTEDGASLTTVASAPLTFTLDGQPVNVVEDSLIPGNNTPLPVKITSATGDINITAGDLNVQLNDIGVNADKTRIGDGSGNYLEINGSNEAKVSDEDGTAALLSILAQLVDIESNTDGLETSFATLNGKDFATQTTLEAARVLLNTISGKDFATQTTLAAILADLQAKADLTETQPVSVTSLPLPSGAATSAKQDSIITAIQNIPAAGDATASNQTTGNTSLGNIDTDLGAPSDAAVSNPASSGSVIALLKGLLTLIVSTNTKLDTLDNNSSPALNSVSNTTAVTNTLLSAPANAIGMIVQNSTSAESAIRFTPSGTTPTASVGFLLGPGQATSYMPAGSIRTISVDGGAIDVAVTWFV